MVTYGVEGGSYSWLHGVADIKQHLCQDFFLLHIWILKCW